MAEFEETEAYFQRIPLLIMISVLVAADVFFAVCYAAGWVKEYWEPVIWILLTAAVIVFCCRFKLYIVLDGGSITVRSVRTRVYPYDRIIDAKKGDIDIMRDYSGWGRGKVKFRTYAVPGIDGAVSVKLTGREVLTLTTARPDELFSIVMSHRRAERCRPPSIGSVSRHSVTPPKRRTSSPRPSGP